VNPKAFPYSAGLCLLPSPSALVLPLFASHDLSELHESEPHLESSIRGKPTAVLWLAQEAESKELFPSICPSPFIQLLRFEKSLKNKPSIKMDTGIQQ
jgi:hypothetical protein